MIKIYQDLLLKNKLNFMINQKKITMSTKKLEFGNAYIVVKRDIALTE